MKNKIDKDDKKEQILYRVVRVIFILAIILIFVLKFQKSDWENTAAMSQNSESTETDISTLVEQTDLSDQAGQTLDKTDDTFTAEDTTADVETPDTADDDASEQPETVNVQTYTFRNDNLLEQHYTKHGIDMGFESAEEYEAAAAAVVNDPDALHKTEAEDGDYIYYLEATNEFVVVSTDGYIRTYFKPDSGKSYYDRQ